MDKTRIIELLQIKFPAFDEPLIEVLFSISEVRFITKKEQVIPFGKTHQQIHIVLDGIFRAYLLKEDGNEIVVLFRKELDFMASWETLFQNRPAELIFEAVTDGIVFSFNQKKLEQLIKQYPNIGEIYHATMQKQLAYMMEHLQSFVYETPEKRYLRLMETNIDLVNEIPIKYLAQFIGITPTSLSRIRKRILNKKMS